MAQHDSLCVPQICGSGTRTNVGFSTGFCSFHFHFLRNKSYKQIPLASSQHPLLPLQSQWFSLRLEAWSMSLTIRARREPGKCLQGEAYGTFEHWRYNGGEWLSVWQLWPKPCLGAPVKFKNSFPIFRQDRELFSLAEIWSVWHPSFLQQLSLLPLGALLCRNVINLFSA